MGRYVHTSTQSVYVSEGDQRESDFDPRSYPVRLGRRSDFDYGEGKRLAEAVFFSRARFPVAAARFLEWLGDQAVTGPLNACSDGALAIGRILELCEEATGRMAAVVAEGTSDERSPFIGRRTRRLDNARARELGFVFSRTLDWLPGAVAWALQKTRR